MLLLDGFELATGGVPVSVPRSFSAKEPMGLLALTTTKYIIYEKSKGNRQMIQARTLL